MLWRRILFFVVFGKRVARIAAVQFAAGVALFVAAGLHGRSQRAEPRLRYATAYDVTVLQNLAERGSCGRWRHGARIRIGSRPPMAVLRRRWLLAAIAIMSKIMAARGGVGVALVRRSAGPDAPLALVSSYFYVPQVVS